MYLENTTFVARRISEKKFLKYLQPCWQLYFGCETVLINSPHITESRQSWILIPRREFRIPGTTFRILYRWNLSLDSSR